MEAISKRITLNNSIPRWIVFQLLEHCDLRCKMCYEWGGKGSYFEKKGLSRLDINVVKKVIEDCSQVKPYIGLFGGEPLLYPWIEEVLSVARHHGCNVDIPTNGTMLEKLAEMLVETKPRRLWISLDGPEKINDEQRGAGVFKRVTKGMDRLYEVRESRGSDLPKIGITYIVTPLTYKYLEEFFFECIDNTKIDHISIEFQTFTTEERHKQYENVLRTIFGVEGAPIARGIVQNPDSFKGIDFKELERQMNRVKKHCEENNIYFISYPKTILKENHRSYFEAKWDKMTDKRTNCAFPWIYTEINARGDVTSCHTLYDLTFGNVNEKSILKIWNSMEYDRFRQYLRKGLLPICTGCARYYSDPIKR